MPLSRSDLKRSLGRSVGLPTEQARCDRCGRIYRFVRRDLAPNDWPKWCDTCDKELYETED